MGWRILSIEFNTVNVYRMNAFYNLTLNSNCNILDSNIGINTDKRATQSCNRLKCAYTRHANPRDGRASAIRGTADDLETKGERTNGMDS